MDDLLTAMADEKDDGAKWLNDFINNNKASDKDFKKARIITSHRATQLRAHQVVLSREKMRFTLAKLVSGGDSDEAKKYLEASQPK